MTVNRIETAKMKCLLCHSTNVRVVFRLQNAPLASQKVLTAEEVKAKGAQKVDVDLYRCDECGMIQIDPTTLHQAGDYWADYLNSRAVADLYVQYDRTLADTLAYRYKGTGRRCVEIGCGDGYFSAELMKRGMDVVAIEPSAKACAVATKAGVKVYNTFLDDNIKQHVEGKFDAFVCKQVMDLLVDHHALLRNLASLLNPGAVGVIDVPSWTKTLVDKRYYSVLPDRVGYYTAATLTRILEMHDFHVVEVFHGAEDEYVGAYVIYEGEKDGLAKAFVAEFDDFNKSFGKLLADAKRNGKVLAGWGAGAKGVTVFSFSGAGPTDIAFVVDRDGNRWGRYMPGSLIPIVSPEQFRSLHADAIIVTAAMFYKEIVRDLVTTFNYKGDIIVFSPLPHVLGVEEIRNIVEGRA